MEYIAENRIVINKSLFLEGMRRISRDSYGKSAAKIMLVLLGLWAAMTGWTVCTGGSVGQTMGYLIPIAIIGLWVCVIMPRSHAKRMWKAQEMTYGSAMERVTRFYDDHLVITGTGLEKEIPYREIRAVRESRNLMILICESRMGILLDRNGFSGGTGEEIRALIAGAEQ